MRAIISLGKRQTLTRMKFSAARARLVPEAILRERNEESLHSTDSNLKKKVRQNAIQTNSSIQLRYFFDIGKDGKRKCKKMRFEREIRGNAGIACRESGQWF